MDSQLALRRRRNISLEGILIGSASTAYILVGYLRRNLAETIRCKHVPLPPRYSPGTPADSLPVKIIHHDRDVEFTSHRFVLR
jgi:hypothetical protein